MDRDCARGRRCGLGLASAAESETRASLSVADRGDGESDGVLRGGAGRRGRAVEQLGVHGGSPSVSPPPASSFFLRIVTAGCAARRLCSPPRDHTGRRSPRGDEHSHGEALALALCGHPAVMKINAAEPAEGLVGITIEHPHDAAEAFEALRERGLAAAQAGIITLGTERVPCAPSHTDKCGSEPSTPRACGVRQRRCVPGRPGSRPRKNLAWPDALALGLGAAAANAEVGGPGRLCPRTCHSARRHSPRRPAWLKPQGSAEADGCRAAPRVRREVSSQWHPPRQRA